MNKFLFRKGTFSRIIEFAGVLSFTLVFVFGQTLLSAVAQEGEPDSGETSTAEVAVSAEAQAAGEAELVVSAEAQIEQTIDLHATLGLTDYDPITHADFGGNILYPLKEITWDVQEGLYNTFASDSSYAQLTADHANKELIAAVEVYTEEPESAGAVVSILNNYHQDLSAVQEELSQVKDEDPNLAKEMASQMVEDHLFVASKVLSTMQDGLVATAPEEMPQLIDLKSAVIATAGAAIVSTADSATEVVETLNILANSNQQTAFSGIINAEILSQVKNSLSGQIAEEMNKAFDQVIDVQLRTVDENLKGLSQVAPEVAADQFQNYFAQLPGQSLDRMKIMDQFKSQTELPPIFIEKMQEAKARMAETIGARIKQVVQEEVRRAMSEAMLQVANPNVDDFKILSEFHDLIPDEQIRQEISRNREQQVQTFLGRFGDDANARAVTAEFEEISKKMENGTLAPDANFFKSIMDLKSRLSPQQQQFIDQMEQMQNTGRQEMFDRAQNDQYFAEKFATFNPADMQIYQQFTGPASSGQFGPPPGFDFAAKFREIEQQQAQNFNQFIGFQNRPEDVRAIQQQFQNFVPQDIRTRFETQFNFDPSAFQQHEQQASEKQQFFQQKFADIQKEFEAKFGPQAGGPPGGFPGTPGFGFPGGANFGPGFMPPPFFQQGGQPDQPVSQVVDWGSCPPGTTQTAYGCELPYQRPQYDPAGSCTASGGTWTGTYCQFSSTYQTPAYQTPTGNYITPYGTDGQYQTPPPYVTPYGDYQTPTYQTPTQYLTPSTGCGPGANWVPDSTNPSGGYCVSNNYQTPSYVYPSPNYPTPTGNQATDCAAAGGIWLSNGYCQMPYPTPPTSYPTPSTSYPTPGTYYPTPGTYYPTPSTSYPTPSTSYPTPSTSYSGTNPATGCAQVGGTWMGTYCQMPSYPTPSTSYPTPSTSYPTPGTYYPTPGTYYPTPSTSYPTPSTSYPTPSYPTPSTSYPTPSYPTPLYPTPDTSYPTPSYPTPLYPTPDTSYPTPSYAYPTPSYAYPTPAYAYPTPAYATPTGYVPNPQVAGTFTRVYEHDLGLFDFLALFGLGVYGYRKRRSTDMV